MRGTVSDIALDETRSRLYIANFGAGRIDVMNTADPKFALGTPLLVSKPPSSVAVSPGNHYLVAGGYDAYNSSLTTPETGGVAIFNLDAGTRQEITLPYPVLSVAFGAGNAALVVSKGDFRLLDPATGKTQVLSVTGLGGAPLPVPAAICEANVFSFPANVTQAATGVSGDQQTVLILAQVTPPSAGACPGDQTVAALLRYTVGSNHVEQYGWTASPPLGPRSVSVNLDASRFIGGWVLMDSNFVDRGDFPNLIANSTMDYRKGGHAFDYSRNLIYADILAAVDDAPVMHVMDSDNLTVRERIQLPQMMSGRSLFSSDMTKVYSVSDGGVLVLPVSTLGSVPQLAALQEDVVFQSDVCTRSVISQSIDVVDLAGGNIDFTLSLPSGTSGIRFSQSTGTTPAKVTISVDPTVFQSNAGTTTVSLTLTSSKAVNVPFPVRLLINTRDLSQRGQILNVPGKLVDILADPVRNRVYVLRQDKNLVLVFDTTTWKQIAAPQLRTGNTPLSMAITPDRNYLLVGNDRSQLINVFDLNVLQPWPLYPSSPFISTPGAYPGSVAAGQGIGTQVVWAAVRDAAPPTTCSNGRIFFRANFPAYAASAPDSMGIYANCLPNPYAAAPMVAATPSGQSIMLAIPDGTVGLWDGTADEWVVMRQDVTKLGGAYGSLSDSIFVTDNRVLDQSLFAQAQLQTTGTTSGVGLSGGAGSDGLRTTTSTAAGPGNIERIDFNPDDGPYYLQTYHGTSLIEAPNTQATLQTAAVGQIGQTISAFTRTLAVPADQSSIVLLTQSGLTILPPDFDAALMIPVVTSVTNVTNNAAAVAPDEQILINGRGLAPGSAVAGTEPLPSTLGDACVTVANQALPLYWVSPTQIKAELPSDVSGAEQLVVHAPGGVSSPFSFEVQATAPAILPVDSGTQAGLARVIRQKNGEVVNFTNPVHAKESISIYMTGLGATAPAVALGAVTPSDQPYLVVTQPTVTLGGTNLPVSFAGLSPGEVGVYRVDVSVPYFIHSAAQSPLVITQGSTSASTLVRVVNP
ncbi:MAG: hypothetical protein P4K98_06100 [Bryobacteraceae bacterium]|nr:hypothetical protein [Bryobacteraceae bacterium]